MKAKFTFVIGIIMLIELIYKLITCPTCEDSIFMFKVPGLVKILFLAVLAAGCFYNVYDNRVKIVKE